MRAHRLIALLFLVCLAGLRSAEAAGRYGVVIGADVGRNEDRALKFAQADAEKFYKVLIELGGFDPSNLVLLLQPDLDEVRATVAGLEERIRQDESLSGGNSLFVLYFSGHAEADAMELGDEDLSFDELREILKKSPATVRLSFLDSCQSGTAVGNKAARRVEGYKLKVKDDLATKGYAILTSSAGDELSQESAEIRGAFFTHYLISGLRGAADASEDGRVSLAEVYHYTYARTVAHTTKVVGGGQHPMFDIHLSGKGELALTTLAKSDAKLVVASPSDGRLVVVDADTERMVAEANAQTGSPVALGLPAGRYRVYHLDAEGKDAKSRTTARVASIDLTASGLELQPGQFEVAKLDEAVSRGGLFIERFNHSIELGAQARPWILDTNGTSVGAQASYRPIAPSRIAPLVQISWVTAKGSFQQVSGTAGFGYAWAFSWVTLWPEALVSLDYLSQPDSDGEQRYTLGFSYGGQLGFLFKLGPVDLRLTAGALGRLFKERSFGLVHRAQFIASLSLGTTF